MHNTIRRLYRRPRIVGASLTSATPGLGESAGVVGGRRSARVVRGSQMALGACLVAVLLATTSLTAAAWGATGGLPGTGDKSFNPAADSEGNHCVSPEGVDANELLGISEYLLVPGACDVVPTGEFYVPLTSAWTMSPSWVEVPADYTPSAPTPLEDFLSKVRAMTFTVDPGTALERSYRFAAQDILDARNVRDVFPISAPDFPNVLFLAKLPPLPPGDHRIAFSIEMSARHCDGLGTASENCLNAGTTSLGSCPFTVMPRQSPAPQREGAVGQVVAGARSEPV
jgi:hypothetical protein